MSAPTLPHGSGMTGRVRELWRPTAGDRGRFIACVLLATGLRGSSPVRTAAVTIRCAGSRWSLAHRGRSTSCSAAWCFWVLLVVGRGARPPCGWPARSVSTVTNRALEPSWAGRCCTCSSSASPSGIRAPSPVPRSSRWSTTSPSTRCSGLGLNVVVGFAGPARPRIHRLLRDRRVHDRLLHQQDGDPVARAFRLEPVLHLPDRGDRRRARRECMLGGPTLRLRGDYLAIVTLGFGEIV